MASALGARCGAPPLRTAERQFRGRRQLVVAQSTSGVHATSLGASPAFPPTPTERLAEAESVYEEAQAALAAAKAAADKSARRLEQMKMQVAAERAADDSLGKAEAKRRSAAGSSPRPEPAEPAAAGTEPAAPKRRVSKAAARLGRQRRARSLGRRKTSTIQASPTPAAEEAAAAVAQEEPAGGARREYEEDEPCVLPKPIYVLSDCTGDSATNTVRAALGQFEQCIDLTLPANMVRFPFLTKEKEVYDICRQASKENALVVFTLVQERMVEAVKVASKLYQVKTVDMWTGLLDEMETHLQVQRVGVPLGQNPQRPKLSTDYFKMIEAVEYTRKQDDGAMPEKWHEADLLVVAVSRCGKTPLSIYLGQRGFKVANLPLVPGVPPPKELYEIDQDRIIGLTIDPIVLHEIRTRRIQDLGVGSSESYDKLRQVRSELADAHKLYDENPSWPVLDVTHTGVEESAARIMRIMAERERERNLKKAESEPKPWDPEGEGAGAGAEESHYEPQDLVWKQLGEW